MKRIVASALVAMMALGGAPLALAQETVNTGIVTGQIPAVVLTSASGGTVLLEDTAGNVAAQLLVSADGSFSFGNVVPGSYIVKVRDAMGNVVAQSLPVEMPVPSTVYVIFGSDRPIAGVPPSTGGGSSSLAYWILGGALAAGIVTAVVIATKNDEGPASPSN
jgi:hypothetical protein